MASFGQLKNNLEILKRFLTRSKAFEKSQILTPDHLDESKLRNNNEFLYQILHYILLDHNGKLKQEIMKKVPLISVAVDKDFIEMAFKFVYQGGVLNFESHGLIIKPEQFQISNKFFEAKIKFLAMLTKCVSAWEDSTIGVNQKFVISSGAGTGSGNRRKKSQHHHTNSNNSGNQRTNRNTNINNQEDDLNLYLPGNKNSLKTNNNNNHSSSSHFANRDNRDLDFDQEEQEEFPQRVLVKPIPLDDSQIELHHHHHHGKQRQNPKQTKRSQASNDRSINFQLTEEEDDNQRGQRIQYQYQQTHQNNFIPRNQQESTHLSMISDITKVPSARLSNYNNLEIKSNRSPRISSNSNTQIDQKNNFNKNMMSKNKNKQVYHEEEQQESPVLKETLKINNGKEKQNRENLQMCKDNVQKVSTKQQLQNRKTKTSIPDSKKSSDNSEQQSESESEKLSSDKFVTRQEFNQYLELLTTVNGTVNNLVEKFNNFQNSMMTWAKNTNARMDMCEQNIKFVKDNL